MCSQLIQRLINCKPGIVSGQLEQYAAGFPEIEGIKVVPVYLRSNVQPLAKYLLPELHLHGFIGYAEGDMVIGSASAEPAAAFRLLHQVDYRCCRHSTGDVSVS